MPLKHGLEGLKSLFCPDVVLSPYQKALLALLEVQEAERIALHKAQAAEREALEHEALADA